MQSHFTPRGNFSARARAFGDIALTPPPPHNQGTLAVGGPAEVWRIGEASGRVRWLNLDPSPFARATTWSVFFGQFVQWGAAYGCHQVRA